jgi:predicted nucleic acid-binding protein
MTSRPVVFDTSVYVGAMRAGPTSEIARLVRSHFGRTHLASVVAAELQAGAITPEARRAVAAVVGTARRVGRLLTPTFAVWLRAGSVMATMRLREPRHASRLPRIWNDLLIALSAHEIGAVVFTANRDDFEFARRHATFELTIVEAPAVSGVR